MGINKAKNQWFGSNVFQLAALLFVVLAFPAGAAADESTLVEDVVGRAAILVDPATARDRAIVDAKVKAARQLGVRVEGKSLVSMGMLLDQFAKVEAFAFVKAFEVTREWKQDDLYFVKIKAWVRTGKEQAEASKEILSNRLILMVADGEGADIARDLLADRLAANGFALLDSAFLGDRVEPATWDCLRTGRLECVGPDFYRFLANTIVRVQSRITPSQNNSGILSFRVNATVTGTQVSTARIEATSRKRGLIFGLDKEQAVQGGRKDQYELAFAEPLVDDFVKKLSHAFGSRKREVQITVDNLPDEKAFANFRRMVQELRWVEAVSGETFAGHRGSLNARYPEKSLYLAAMIGYRGIYEVTDYGWDRMQVTYIGHRQ